MVTVIYPDYSLVPAAYYCYFKSVVIESFPFHSHSHPHHDHCYYHTFVMSSDCLCWMNPVNIETGVAS